MRTDTESFKVKNAEVSKRPRYVIELAFDTSNTILWYFTSHSDVPLPGGVSSILGVLDGMSGTSQTLNPDLANATIGSINFQLVDKASIVTSTLGSQLTLGRSTRRQRVRVYVGFEGMAWADYTLVQTQLVTRIDFEGGLYKFNCSDIQREMRKELFELAKTTMSQTATADAATIEVVDTASFVMVTHSASFTDAPNATVGYIKIQEEVIRYTGKTATQFTGCTRGALNTKAAEHVVDLAAASDRRTAVEEYVYLEMPAVQMMYALMTGNVPDAPISESISAPYDSSLWQAGVDPVGYSLNESVDDEAHWLIRPGPSGDSEVVHVCIIRDFGTTPSADGGWNMTVGLPIDNNKGYLFTCFMKRKTPNGQHYWGMYTDSALMSGGGHELAGGGTHGGGGGDSNPYFMSGIVGSAFPNNDQWYLVVGFLHPNSYAGIYSGISGVYDPATGLKIKTGKEYRLTSDTSAIRHRAYHYYNGTDVNGTEVQQMARPRIYQCDLVNAPAMIAAIANTANRLPASWNLGISKNYVRHADYVSHKDLYDWRDERRGFITRFEDLEKDDGKKFIESELALLIGSFMPVYADGSLGLKRMANILAGSAYVKQLNDKNLVKVSALTHNFEALRNVVQINWNWEPAREDFTRVNLLIDAASVTVHGKAEPLKLKFRGLHGSRHSSTMLAQRFDAIRDRYTSPPLKVDVTGVPSLNNLEVGDVVRLNLPILRDFVVNGPLDRSFEIHNTSIDWITGEVKQSLFASSQAPGAVSPTADSVALADAWYTGEGFRWEYNNSLEGWGNSNITATLNSTYVSLDSTSNDPMWRISGLSILGSQYRYLVVRLRRTAGSTWHGAQFYSTGGHGENSSFHKTIADPTGGIVGDWVYAVWDMHALTLGGNDWRDNIITALRFDFGADAADSFDVDWIAYTPYIHLGVALTINTSGQVTAGGNLWGDVNFESPNAVYYFDGDLTINNGVTVNLHNNVQLRIRGFLQNNGILNGKGNGLVGATSPGAPNSTAYNPGIAGFIGTPIAGGGMVYDPSVFGRRNLNSFEGARVSGVNASVPSFNLMWNGVILSGLPTDLRGSSGSSGMPATILGASYVVGHTNTTLHAGGAGGDGGAGLCIICRGFGQGVSAKIDLSGDDGAVGATGTMGSTPLLELFVHAGSGAGGAPGGLLIALDGSIANATGLTEAGFVALYGKTPITGTSQNSPRTVPQVEFEHVYSHFVGNGDGSLFTLPSLSGSRGGSRVQYIPANITANPDSSNAVLPPPTNVGLASGTNELLIQIDGTVIPRLKVTWTPTSDGRVLAYDVQFKRSTDTIYSNSPTVWGGLSDTSWIVGVKDGVNYDVRIRSAGATREVSEWLTILGYTVLGKSDKPSNVGALSFTDPVLSWSPITDADRRGYVVRYQPGVSTDWASATPAHVEGFITETSFDTGSIVGGQTTMLVKAIDTSGNESTSVSSLTVDLRPATPTSFTLSRQPDGTREFSWGLLSPPVDLDGFKIRYFLGSTSDWNAMTDLHNGLLIAAPFESNQLAAGIFTFAIKSVDRAGNQSANALFINQTLGDPRIAGAIEDLREEPIWPGTKTSCHVDVATGWLVADGTATWNSLPATWNGWTEWNHTPVSPIVYERLIDIGLKVKFTPLVTAVADGAQVIEEQHSDDGVGYSSYAAVGPQIDARYVRIKITITGSYPKIKALRIVLSAGFISEIIEDQNTASLAGAYRIGVGDIRIPITKVYTIIKKVDLTLQSVGAGWSWELVDKNTATGPRVRIYNASNTLADAVIDATVTGI